MYIYIYVCVWWGCVRARTYSKLEYNFLQLSYYYSTIELRKILNLLDYSIREKILKYT